MNTSRFLIWFAGLFTIIAFMTGCSASKRMEQKYLGKTWPLSNFRSLNNSGQNFQKTKNFDIEYNYMVDQNAKTINFSGTMQYSVNIDESKYRTETILLEIKMCEVIFIFADRDGKIVDVKGCYAKSYQNIYDPILFETTMPFKKEYERVRIGYSFRAQGN